MTNFSSSPPIAFGDLQGCHAAYRQLFDTLAPAADTPLWFAGDLVNRGPASLATLREIVALGERAIAVLGNHDLHLLAVAAGIRTLKPGDTIGEILDAPDADDLIEWVRHRPFAHFERGMLMVHAGLLPQWDAALALELADELQRALRAPNWRDTLRSLYGNDPNCWSPDLKHADRLRVAFNAFTRIRFLHAGRRDGVSGERRPGGRARRLPALVRRARTENRRRDGRVRPLGRVGADAARESGRAGFGMRVGQPPVRRAARRRSGRARGHAGRMRALRRSGRIAARMPMRVPIRAAGLPPPVLAHG